MALPVANNIFRRALLVAGALTLASAVASAQDFRLAFHNHRVTLVAQNVTVAAVLAQWARIGGTAVINDDAIKDGPVSLQLIDVPELEALEILLRSAGGYIVAERDDAFDESASSISRIMILPKSAAPVRNQATATFAPTVAFERAEPEARPTVFVPPPPEAPFVATPSAAAAVSEAAVPAVPAPSRGTARPGEPTPELPPLFRPTSTPMGRPGEAPAPESTVMVSGGRRLAQQQQQ